MNQALIVMKKTKFELDFSNYHEDLEFYKRICKIQNNSFDKIYNSHLRQLQSREVLQKFIFPNEKFIFRDDLDHLDLSLYEKIVSLGGDNHFTYVAHHCTDHLVVGCNSDVVTSAGALLSFNPDTLKETVEHNWKNTIIEEWSMICAEIEYPNGSTIKTVNAVSEVSVRNASPDLTSRYVILYDGITEEQKSSGALLYTGAGSTGWYASCIGVEEEESVAFSRSADYFKFYSRELSHKARKKFKLTDFVVNGSIRVISEMNGGISIDALPERIYPFPHGAVATFKLADQKLKVIKRC